MLPQGPAGPPSTGPTPAGALIRAECLSRTWGLTIDKWVIDAQLELLLGRPVASTIPLASTIELDVGIGRSWQRLLRQFTDVLNRHDHTFLTPIVAEPLCHALIAGLLLICDNPYSEALRQPAKTCRPRHVKIALDAMHCHPEHPHTSASLAQLADVSIRNLQEGFRRHFSVPPMAYLRQLRLTRAHEDPTKGKAVAWPSGCDNSNWAVFPRSTPRPDQDNCRAAARQFRLVRARPRDGNRTRQRPSLAT
jgi:hypothetical protein